MGRLRGLVYFVIFLFFSLFTANSCWAFDFNHDGTADTIELVDQPGGNGGYRRIVIHDGKTGKSIDSSEDLSFSWDGGYFVKNNLLFIYFPSQATENTQRSRISAVMAKYYYKVTAYNFRPAEGKMRIYFRYTTKKGYPKNSGNNFSEKEIINECSTVLEKLEEKYKLAYAVAVKFWGYLRKDDKESLSKAKAMNPNYIGESFSNMPKDCDIQIKPENGNIIYDGRSVYYHFKGYGNGHLIEIFVNDRMRIDTCAADGNNAIYYLYD